MDQAQTRQEHGQVALGGLHGAGRDGQRRRPQQRPDRVGIDPADAMARENRLDVARGRC